MGTPRLPEQPIYPNEGVDWQRHIIGHFYGGLTTSFENRTLDDNQLLVLANFIMKDNGALKCRDPYRPYNTGGDTSVLATAPLRFKWGTFTTASGDIDRLLSVRDGGGDYNIIDYWNGSAWAEVARTTMLDDYDVEMVPFTVNEYTDMLICDGNGTPLAWNPTGGVRTMGLAVPTLTTLEAGVISEQAANARGLTKSGTYYYKLSAFYSAGTLYGESGATAILNNPTGFAIAEHSTPGDPFHIALTNLPAIPANATRVYVYRSPVDEINGPFERVGYYSSGTAFTDTTPNGEEGVEPVLDFGFSELRPKHPAVINGYFVCAGLNSNGELGNKLCWSLKGIPDVFPSLNYTYLDGDIKKIIEFNGNTYIFTTQKIYFVAGMDPDSNKPLVICERGTTSSASVVDVGNGIVFLSDGNVFWVDFNTQSNDGDFPIPIGEPIKDIFDAIPVAQAYKAAGVFCDGKYYLSFPISGSTNNATRCWNVKVGIALYSNGKYGGWSALSWDSNHSQVFKKVLYTADDTNKYIMEHGQTAATQDKNTHAAGLVDISVALETKDFDFGHEIARKIFGSISVLGDGPATVYSGLITVDANKFNKAFTITMGSEDASYDFTSKYGAGTYGNAVYAPGPNTSRKHHRKIPRGVKGRTFAVSLQSTDGGSSIITSLVNYFKPLAPPS